MLMHNSADTLFLSFYLKMAAFHTEEVVLKKEKMGIGEK